MVFAREMFLFGWQERKVVDKQLPDINLTLRNVSMYFHCVQSFEDAEVANIARRGLLVDGY